MFYPTKVFIYQYKSATALHIGCRPDALSPLCADLCVIGGRSAPVIRVGGVEHHGDDIASFLLIVEVPRHLQEEVKTLMEKYSSEQ